MKKGFKALAMLAIAVVVLFMLLNSGESTSSRTAKPAPIQHPVYQPVDGYDAPPHIVPKDFSKGDLVLLR